MFQMPSPNRSVPCFLLALCMVFHAQASASSTTQSLIGDAPFSGSGVNRPSPDAVSDRKFGVNHPEFDTAWEIDVRVKPKHVHQSQLSSRSQGRVRKGDTVVVDFWARRSDGASQPGQGSIYIQLGAPPYTPQKHKVLTFGADWKHYQLNFKAERDYAHDGLLFNILLGYQVQTVQIGGLRVLNHGQDVDAADLRQTYKPQPIREDFEADWLPMPPAPEGHPTNRTGQLPTGWVEDSVWKGANVDVHVEPQLDNPFEGDASMRIVVDEIRDQRVQINRLEVPLYPRHFTRIRVAVRSLAASRVRFVMQKDGAPWTTYWQNLVVAAPEWREFSYVIPPSSVDPSARFMIIFNQPGELEIDDLRIDYLDPNDVETGSFDGNLLPISRFPGGPTTPWVYQPLEDPNHSYEADPSQLGPSGMPSLKITPTNEPGDRPIAQLTVPFQGKHATEHTFSVWAKGSRPGQVVHLRMGPTNKQLWLAPWQSNMQLTTEWERYDLTVKLPFTEEGFYIARLTTHDPQVFWIDQAQVVLGSEPGEYTPVDDIELGLRQSANYGVHFLGKPLTFDAVAIGDAPEGAKLLVKIEDINDKTVELEPIPLTAINAQGFAIQPVTVDPQGLSPVGVYRIEAVVQDADGNALSSPTEIVVARVREPKLAGQRMPDSPFGVHVAGTPEQAKLARDLGFKWVRMNYGIQWRSVEPEEGVWDFSAIDSRIDAFEENDLMILVALGGVPKRQSTAPATYNGWFDRNFVPKDIDAFAEYTKRVAEHYRGRIQHYEVWNEPFLPNFLIRDYVDGRFVHGTPAQYVEMHHKAYAAMKSVAPETVVMWNAGPHYDEAWNREVVDLGIRRSVDILTFHLYTNTVLGTPNDAAQRAITATRDLWTGSDQITEIWNSEGGASGNDPMATRITPPLGRRDHNRLYADHVTRYYLSHLVNGAKNFFLYHLNGYSHFNPSYDYMNHDGSVSFPLVAISNMAWHLEGKPFGQTHDLGRGIYVHQFADADETVFVISSTGSKALEIESLPEGASLADIYGNTIALPANVGTSVAYLRVPSNAADAAITVLKSGAQ
ncbi:MAG: beta-galactosidase [Planctomycetota bacterium]